MTGRIILPGGLDSTFELNRRLDEILGENGDSEVVMPPERLVERLLVAWARAEEVREGSQVLPRADGVELAIAIQDLLGLEFGDLRLELRLHLAQLQIGSASCTERG